MCYSAQVWASYRQYAKRFGAKVDMEAFLRLYRDRQAGSGAKWPKAMDAAFAKSESDAEQEILSLIQQFNAEQASKLEQELFKQKKRLADAERTLQTKTTKTAQESQRIASDKIAKSLARLSDLRRTELKDRDARIFPGYYAPVMIVENGERIVRPMRYQCRPAGKPASYDHRYPGTYNARRNNLTGFWKEQFGATHGVMVVNAFYEHVSRHGLEGRELAEGEKDESVVLEFKPRPAHDMLVACLWSHWQGKGQPDLWSFAAITDEPPPEVAAAGHDRCIVPIEENNLDAWLNPDGRSLNALDAILEDRDRPYYEHRLAKQA